MLRESKTKVNLLHPYVRGTNDGKSPPNGVREEAEHLPHENEPDPKTSKEWNEWEEWNVASFSPAT